MAKRIAGVVTKIGDDWSCTVEINYLKRHSEYGKPVERRTRYSCDREGIELKTGDKVEIVATRPLSKSKTWRIVAVHTGTSGGAS